MDAQELKTLRDDVSRILADEDPQTRRSELSRRLAEARPEDVAELITGFPDDSTYAIFESLPPEDRAEVLFETDDASTRVLTRRLPQARLADIIEQMPLDEATDTLEELSDADREDLLDRMDPGVAESLRQLLRYAPESAGGIMTPGFFAVSPSDTAGQALESLQRTIETEVLQYIYVVEGTDRIVGVMSLRELLAADPEDRVESIMNSEVISVRVDDDQEDVANTARKYNLSVIPVVDASGRLRGAATIDDLLNVVHDEAEEDIFRIAGTEGRQPTSRKALNRAFARLPWLLLPAISGFVVAALSEDKDLQSTAQLWAFMPLVMGISGAVGTQSATILVRGIATGEVETGRGFRVWVQELVIALSVAVVLGLLSAGVLVVEGQFGMISAGHELPLAISLGLVAGILLATLIGATLPFACDAINLDPALVAGPFITSLNDVLAASTFLGIGHLVLRTAGG